MSYEILGSSGQYWSCNQLAWRDYLKVATAFGWTPEGAFFKCDEIGSGEHPSGSYLGNDWQIVTDDDARATAAALNLAVAAINAGAPMTDDQTTALRAFEIEPLFDDDAESLASCSVQTIRTRNGSSFKINVCHMMALADVANAGGFTIA
jgi:hypothetical protein